MFNTKVTIFIPLFNGEDYIKETIESALKQDFSDFEVLVIDDGSTDNSLKILSGFTDNRIRIVTNNTNMGRPFTRNRGIELARGEYLAVLDSDDIAETNRLSRQVEFLDKNADIAAVGSFAWYIDDTGNTAFLCEVPTKWTEIAKEILYTNCFIHSSVMFRKQVLIDVGGYNLDFPQAQDYELFLRLCEHYKLANIAEPLIKYRIHSKQVSQTKLASQTRLANLARLNSYKRRKLNKILPSSVTAEPNPDIFDKLTAQKGTLGSNLLSYIHLYRQLKKHKIADKLILSALLASPFSKEIYKEIYFYILRSPLINRLFWYFKRIINY